MYPNRRNHFSRSIGNSARTLLMENTIKVLLNIKYICSPYLRALYVWMKTLPTAWRKHCRVTEKNRKSVLGWAADLWEHVLSVAHKEMDLLLFPVKRKNSRIPRSWVICAPDRSIDGH